MNDVSQDAYWDLVERVISQGNDAAQEHDLGLAAAALMHAAARFAAFYAAASSASRKDFKEDRDSLLRDITRDFKTQLGQQLDDYIEHYKVYLQRGDEEC